MAHSHPYVYAGSEHLHRVVARQTYGHLPDGYHVHHVDGDYRNNAPDNLVIVTPEDHRRMHMPQHWQRDPHTGEWLKRCSKCHRFRSLDCYSPTGEPRRAPYCKSCRCQPRGRLFQRTLLHHLANRQK